VQGGVHVEKATLHLGKATVPVSVAAAAALLGDRLDVGASSVASVVGVGADGQSRVVEVVQVTLELERHVLGVHREARNAVCVDDERRVVAGAHSQIETRTICDGGNRSAGIDNRARAGNRG